MSAHSLISVKFSIFEPNVLRFALCALAMSLESIIARAELERHGYHELSEEQLRLKDPEALLSSAESAYGSELVQDGWR
jgi:hypothetical protein